MNVASRAFRAPQRPEDLADILRFYQRGQADGGFEAGIQQALSRVLIDPRFLFRFEAEPGSAAPAHAFGISDMELASRLSFFLWSSIPDAQLMDLAVKKELHRPEVLAAQVRRMLADPKAYALVENFAGQWLHLRELATVTPEVEGFDENLREAFHRGNPPAGGLGAHAGSPRDRAADGGLHVPQRAPREALRHSRRAGLPFPEGEAAAGFSPPRGAGSRQHSHDHVDRESHVAGDPRQLDTRESAGRAGRRRRRPVWRPTSMATALRSSRPRCASGWRIIARIPSCASCHNVMDPVGFALENFNAIGAWRERDGDSAIDASGTLVDGTKVVGPEDLTTALMSKSDLFVTNVVEKLMTYALGRTVDYHDMPAVRAVVKQAQREDLRVQRPDTGRRAERAVPLPDQAAAGRGGCRPREPAEAEELWRISSPADIFLAARFCAAPARPLRCRCWTRWFRR